MKSLLSWDSDKQLGFYPVTEPWYDDEYFEASISNSKSDIADNLNKFRVEIVNKYIKGKVLDFGCGCGQFIEYRGNALGFDICPKAIENLRNKKKYMDFWNGGMDSTEIEGITMFDVLEHLRDPELVLSQIKCRWLIISVPIFETKEKALNSRHFKPREHFWYFSHRSIIELMEKNGFVMVECRDDETKIGRAEILTYVFKRKRSMEIGERCDSCWKNRNDFKPLVGNLYLCPEKLTLFENVSKIEENVCFWDNAAFKIVDEGG